jgi:molybdopterin converting factor small subunit
MKVTVKLLATYRSLLPDGTTGNTCIIELPDGSTYKSILTYFQIEDDRTNVVLVNGLTPDPSDPLNEGDTVCVFSAMAGG